MRILRFCNSHEDFVGVDLTELSSLRGSYVPAGEGLVIGYIQHEDGSCTTKTWKMPCATLDTITVRFVSHGEESRPDSQELLEPADIEGVENELREAEGLLKEIASKKPTVPHTKIPLSKLMEGRIKIDDTDIGVISGEHVQLDIEWDPTDGCIVTLWSHDHRTRRAGDRFIQETLGDRNLCSVTFGNAS